MDNLRLQKRDRPAAPGTASTKNFYSQFINLDFGCQGGRDSHEW